ncbi:MAG TPA: cbb3-type cytochrome c oxidase subunit II, partial [Phenylobacterium sp.]|nr:cbb3-type cytochrome c oxidase subunit II [Phenylobacterium sp.]
TAMVRVGVPYTQDMLDSASADLRDQADPFAPARGIKGRYGDKVQQRDFDGDPTRLTEMDALIAYLQMLGTLVDFSTYQAEAPENLR